MVKNKHKLLHIIPGIIVGGIMIGIVIWGISGDKRCRNLLEDSRCEVQFVFCKYSKESMRGSGFEVSTGFVNPNDTLQYFTTQAFVKPLPIGSPIMVKYSLESEHCYEFLWDSTVVFNNYKIRYFKVKNQGMDYEITKLNNADK